MSHGAEIQSTEDTGMWKELYDHFWEFHEQYVGDPRDDPPSIDAQYAFVESFRVDFDHAAHNKDLWQSMTQASIAIVSARTK